MENRSQIIVGKENIICLAENFYCVGIVMSKAFGKFRNTSPRVYDDAQAGRRDLQTAAEKLSHNMVKRWRMDETRTRMGSIYFELLSTRRVTGVKENH